MKNKILRNFTAMGLALSMVCGAAMCEGTTNDYTFSDNEQHSTSVGVQLDIPIEYTIQLPSLITFEPGAEDDPVYANYYVSTINAKIKFDIGDDNCIVVNPIKNHYDGDNIVLAVNDSTSVVAHFVKYDIDGDGNKTPVIYNDGTKYGFDNKAKMIKIVSYTGGADGQSNNATGIGSSPGWDNYCDEQIKFEKSAAKSEFQEFEIGKITVPKSKGKPGETYNGNIQIVYCVKAKNS